MRLAPALLLALAAACTRASVGPPDTGAAAAAPGAPAAADLEDPREEEARAASEARPDDPVLKARVARISFERRRLDEAVLRQKEALALAPDSATIARDLGAYLAARVMVMGKSVRTSFPADGLSLSRRGGEVVVELAQPACVEVVALVREGGKRVGLLWARVGTTPLRGRADARWPPAAALELAQLTDCAGTEPVWHVYAHAPADDVVP